MLQELPLTSSLADVPAVPYVLHSRKCEHTSTCIHKRAGCAFLYQYLMVYYLLFWRVDVFYRIFACSGRV